ncbi:hypothetical protein CIP107509_02339 [Corynebacterium diphtheriae]|nr:hypothetical protein AY499_06190 [Corynebacterium diphtheriae bv. gravis]OWN76797.1 hypothetical protein AY520_11200 [Corynebacterium diphtheriae bv. mitis]CAB0524637.1 hypothetical protein FRC061569_02012 [Corynebacterium diphtheriae]OWO62482.1 hypothetical protein AY477_09725 [Corynebacterium diphtheriae bv. mitis]CAB0528239.1 hypothetical protein FRC020322_02252 [Corynebacterium diphtheriae]
MTSVISLLAEQPVLLVALLIGIGMALGSIKVRSISLGAAAVLFLAIAISAAGAASGVAFFQSLRSAGGPICAMIGLFLAATIAGTISSGIDQLLVILYGMLALSILVAILGIINTLVLNVIERKQ